MTNKTIDMQLMRYINLFERISRVSTTNCFVYNNTIYFAVPKSKMSLAIGRDAVNVKEMSNTLRKKIRVVGMVSDEVPEEKRADYIREFIREVVAPVEFSSFEFKDGVITISGTREQKAMMIGRDRSREKELAEVLQVMFGVKEFKIM